MRDDICTIPVSEVFEINDGCPLCRMRDTVEKHLVSYILGDAMMEPDVRIETNKIGFCEHHYNEMMSTRGRLQLALMLESHMDEIINNSFEKGILHTPQKRGEKAKNINDNCFICEKIEFGFSRMIETIYRTYEAEEDFRALFNSQPQFCLRHFERLISGADKRLMRKTYGEFCDNLTRVAADYAKSLKQNISDYCALYDYRSSKENISDECKDAVEKTVAFLNGRYY